MHEYFVGEFSSCILEGAMSIHIHPSTKRGRILEVLLSGGTLHLYVWHKVLLLQVVGIRSLLFLPPHHRSFMGMPTPPRGFYP
jgi:hypothetical protein